jgi:nucleotide-binding universal stress UspA family protein
MSALWPHIACFVDESEASRAALGHAFRLRAEAPGRLSVVHVAFGPPHDTPPAPPAWLRDAAAGAGGEPVLVVNLGSPAAAACEWADTRHVDLIVASAHRDLRQRFLLGSFAGHLAHHAPCSALLVRPREDRVPLV